MTESYTMYSIIYTICCKQILKYLYNITSLSTDGVSDIKLVPGLKKTYRAAFEMYITALLTPKYIYG